MLCLIIVIAMVFFWVQCKMYITQIDCKDVLFFLEEWKVEKTSPKWRIKCQHQENNCDHITHLPFLISSLIDFLPGVWLPFLKKQLQSSFNNSKWSCICCLSACISAFNFCYESTFHYHSVCLIWETFTRIFNIFPLSQYQGFPQYHLNKGAVFYKERNSQKVSYF